ncbi:DUF3313 domain-containing protein [Verrucomicrobiales bacterium BCK34]|nr:DUF3313 domain-containing protein [Verrucomicrobiales bacterium BCK34]
MVIQRALLFLPFFLLVSCETTEPDKRHYLSSYRGLETQTGPLGNPSLVRSADPERLKRYTKVIIEDVKVIPTKNQDPKLKYATREESEQLAEQFEDILEKELGKSYEITKRRGYNTLAVRAALTELRPSNPALFAVNYMPYVGVAATAVQVLSEKKEALGAGSASIEAEVVDSRSRRQLYAMVDQLKGGKLQPGSLEKWGQAQGAMRGWSRKIHRGIKANAPATSTTKKPAAQKPATKKPEKKKPAPASKKKDSETKTPFWKKAEA